MIDRDIISQSSTECYSVSSPTPVHPGDVLHVSNFYRNQQRVHMKTMKERQDMILYFAYIHKEATKSGMPLAFCQIPMSLLKLRKWVYDYRVIFDHFFEVYETGYNVNDKTRDISIVIPKKLSEHSQHQISIRSMVYQPPEVPDTGVISKAYIQFENANAIRSKLIETKRFDLFAPVEWLLSRPCSEINVWYAPSGKLQLRDTSVWPIKAIETWPSWLRIALFGEGIDIESAYTQYILEVLKESFKDNPSSFEMLFPELIQSLEDKHNWRTKLCCDIGLAVTHDNISLVKRICMALANGSKVSGKILSGNSQYSCIRDILIEKIPGITSDKLDIIGLRLSKIAREHTLARKLVCLHESKIYPSSTNQKQVFRSYFEWEREARYELWNAIGQVGIMVHDGIEGIPSSILKQAHLKLSTLKIRIST